MKKFLPLILLLAVAAAQLAVPAGMIARHEAALTHGVSLKFRTGIRDPYDPFRGRYVWLNFELSRLPTPLPVEGDAFNHQPTRSRQPLYVQFEPDADGFATVKAISTEKPAAGPYLRLPCRIYDHKVARLDLPFDRYFMNEEAAPEAERRYREAIRENRRNGDNWSDDNYARVKILDGTAALEALIVDGQPIEDLLEQPPSPQTEV